MHALEPTRDWIIAPIDASQSITHEKSIEQVAAKDRQQVTISIVRPPMRAELETNELSRSMTLFRRKNFYNKKSIVLTFSAIILSFVSDRDATT